MPARLIAISDIHGCLAALRTILDAVKPESDDTIVALGDYIDRGPDSRGVIDCLIKLQSSCNLVPLLGNHDAMLIDVCSGREDLLADWLLFGGNATLSSYGVLRPDKIPQNHIAFLEDCLLYYETEKHVFLHATYDPALPLDRQTLQSLLWDKLRPAPPGPHCSGKTVIVGHTAQRTRRNPGPGLPQVHRHLLLRRRLAHGPGRHIRPNLAGRQVRKTPGLNRMRFRDRPFCVRLARGAPCAAWSLPMTLTALHQLEPRYRLEQATITLAPCFALGASYYETSRHVAEHLAKTACGFLMMVKKMRTTGRRQQKQDCLAASVRELTNYAAGVKLNLTIWPRGRPRKVGKK